MNGSRKVQRRWSVAVATTAVALLLGMATATAQPAEVKSEQAVPGQPGETLRGDPLDAPAATSVSDASRSAEMNRMMAESGHGMAHGNYVHEDAGRGSVAAPHPSPAANPKSLDATYTCPMHPEVQSDRPGKCPKCGMALVMKEKQ